MTIAKRLPIATLVMSCALAAVAAHAEDRSAGRALDDAAITTKVKAELIANPDTKAYQINVDTNNGVVSLSGFVDSAAQKHAAGAEAEAVAGVKSVENRLMVKNSAGSADSSSAVSSATAKAKKSWDDTAVTAKVKAKLTGDSTVKARDINVETNNGIVQLNGFVSSKAEKEQAAELASSVEGVMEVKNQLQIR